MIICEITIFKPLPIKGILGVEKFQLLHDSLN